jgi:hypothetical protein
MQKNRTFPAIGVALLTAFSASKAEAMQSLHIASNPRIAGVSECTGKNLTDSILLVTPYPATHSAFPAFILEYQDGKLDVTIDKRALARLAPEEEPAAKAKADTVAHKILQRKRQHCSSFGWEAKPLAPSFTI